MINYFSTLIFALFFFSQTFCALVPYVTRIEQHTSRKCPQGRLFFRIPNINKKFVLVTEDSQRFINDHIFVFLDQKPHNVGWTWQQEFENHANSPYSLYQLSICLQNQGEKITLYLNYPGDFPPDAQVFTLTLHNPFIPPTLSHPFYPYLPPTPGPAPFLYSTFTPPSLPYAPHHFPTLPPPPSSPALLSRVAQLEEQLRAAHLTLSEQTLMQKRITSLEAQVKQAITDKRSDETIADLRHHINQLQEQVWTLTLKDESSSQQPSVHILEQDPVFIEPASSLQEDTIPLQERTQDLDASSCEPSPSSTSLSTSSLTSSSPAPSPLEQKRLQRKAQQKEKEETAKRLREEQQQAVVLKEAARRQAQREEALRRNEAQACKKEAERLQAEQEAALQSSKPIKKAQPKKPKAQPTLSQDKQDALEQEKAEKLYQEHWIQGRYSEALAVASQPLFPPKHTVIYQALTLMEILQADNPSDQETLRKQVNLLQKPLEDLAKQPGHESRDQACTALLQLFPEEMNRYFALAMQEGTLEQKLMYLQIRLIHEDDKRCYEKTASCLKNLAGRHGIGALKKISTWYQIQVLLNDASPDNALKICNEGLEKFPDNTQLHILHKGLSIKLKTLEEQKRQAVILVQTADPSKGVAFSIKATVESFKQLHSLFNGMRTTQSSQNSEPKSDAFRLAAETLKTLPAGSPDWWDCQSTLLLSRAISFPQEKLPFTWAALDCMRKGNPDSLTHQTNTLLVDDILNHLTKEEALAIAEKMCASPASFGNDIVAVSCLSVARKCSALNETLQAYEWIQKANTYRPGAYTAQVEKYRQLMATQTAAHESSPTTSQEWAEKGIQLLEQRNHESSARNFYLLHKATRCFERTDLTRSDNLLMLLKIGYLYARRYSHSLFSIPQLTTWKPQITMLSQIDPLHTKEYETANGELLFLLAMTLKQEGNYAAAFVLLGKALPFIQDDSIILIKKEFEIMTALINEVSEKASPSKHARTDEPTSIEPAIAH